MAGSTPRRLSNTRPRDALGRPLPWGAEGEPMVPEREFIASSDAVAEALEYLREGRPFHAHEVLEQRWRCAPEDDREWWRALAQAAAGITQEARGNEAGAQRLRDRARASIQSSAQPNDVVSDHISALLEQLDLA